MRVLLNRRLALGRIAACARPPRPKIETSKCAFVDEGVHVLLIDAIGQPGTSDDALKADLWRPAELCHRGRSQAHHLEYWRSIPKPVCPYENCIRIVLCIAPHSDL